jgi:hypothetical protein
MGYKLYIIMLDEELVVRSLAHVSPPPLGWFNPSLFIG